MERPVRVLIEVLGAIDKDLLRVVSPGSGLLKKMIKWPMLFLIWSSSMQSSLSVVMFKLFGELIQSGTWSQHLWMMAILLAMLAVAASLQIHLLNLAMKYYD